MSNIALVSPATGTATFSITTPSGTSTDRTLTLPDNSGTVITTASTFAGTGPALQANNTSDQIFSAVTNTKILFQNASVDTASCFSSSTFTPNVAGYYWVYGQISPRSNTSQEITLGLAKNGTVINRLARQSGNSLYTTYFSGGMLVFCNGSTDYIEIFCFTQAAFTSENPYSTFAATLIRGA
jgi:hypothetical protein